MKSLFRASSFIYQESSIPRSLLSRLSSGTEEKIPEILSKKWMPERDGCDVPVPTTNQRSTKGEVC